MSVIGIGTTGYPIAGYDTRKTERNVAGGNFAKQVAEAAQAAGTASTVTLHGAEEGTGDIAIFSGAEVVSGTSFSVYRTQDFDSENPIYKVKMWDESGNVTEQMVDWVKVVNDIMQSAYQYGDLKGYMEWKKFLDLLK